MVGNHLGLSKVRSTLQTYCKRVQARPVGLGLRVVLDAMLAELLGNGRDDRRIKTARKQYTVGHVTHQLTFDGSCETIADSLDAGRIVLDGIVLHPVAAVVPFLTRRHAPIVVARQERLVALALAFEGLEFAGDIDGAVAVVANIKRYDANGVTGYEEFVALLVVKHKGKDTAEVFEEVDALLAIKRQDNFTVGARLELVLSGIAATNLLMVIDFAVDSQHLLLVRRIQRLTTRFRVHDAQTLVGKDGASATIDTTPVRSAVTDFLTHLQYFLAELMRLLLNIQYSNDSTHKIISIKGFTIYYLKIR